jgi:hypothetical protein
MIGGMRPARCTWLLAAVLAAGAATPAAAKSYSAERFDAIVRVLPGGTLDVTETVVFRFEDGTFSEVFREVPRRRTDGIEIVRAEMDGQRLPFGNERGTAEVLTRNGRVRVIWRFGPVEGVTRAFVLNYRVRGAVRQEAQADLLAWRATPGEHHYRIAASDIRFELPVAPEGTPHVIARKTAAPRVRVDGTIVHVTGSDIGQNGWIDTSLSFSRGALIDRPPAWQQDALDVAARAPAWIFAATMVVLAGLIVLISWRQSYDAPSRELQWAHGDSQQSEPPDGSDPAIAGVLAANGRPALEHAMAALFALAERGEIDIAEKPRGMLGQRDFVITRRRSHDRLAGYERAALETIFKGQAEQGSTVTLSQARTRLSLRFRAFSRQLTEELIGTGLADRARKAIRDRYNRSAMWLLVAGGLGIGPAALFVREHGGWPLLIPAALMLLALAAVIFAATVTPLSNEGVRRGYRWREYRKHLMAIAQGKRMPLHGAEQLPLAIAISVGLASAWSKFLKQRGHPAPAWFHPLSDGDAHSAFSAFIATGGAGSSGGAGGGAGAAGGGASGAR